VSTFGVQTCTASTARLRCGCIALAILLLAAIWRIVVAWALPCLARDSVNFCEYARDLGGRGIQYLKEPTTRQHPLFPILVLGVQRLARQLGAADRPMTWQRSGQVVSVLAGLTVVLLTGVWTRRVVRRLEPSANPSSAGCCAMLLAALLPLNVALSAEAMSDQLHLAFYLAGVIALLQLDSLFGAAGCGLAAGGAFLTRPEGAVVALAGCVGSFLEPVLRLRARLTRSMLILGFFVACAAPYWAITGRLSPKKDPFKLLRSVFVASESSGPPARPAGLPTTLTFARLELLDLPWYGVLPWLLYELFRAGRVVVPLLAVPGLLKWRHRLLRAPFTGLSVCVTGHLLLTLLLLGKERYLAPRHLLVVVTLLTPFSALALVRVVDLARAGRWPWPAAVAVFAAVLGPLVAYSLRLPNAADRYLPDAAGYLLQCDPALPGKTVMSGSSLRRVAFYAGARWIPWYEIPEQAEQLAREILRVRPDYFLIETGPGFEREGNDGVVTVLDSNRDIAAFLQRRHRIEVPRGGWLHVFQFAWPAVR
jgi:hypothetical protein